MIKRVSNHGPSINLIDYSFDLLSKAVCYLPLLVFLLSCASAPKEEPFTWKVTFFSLGAKVQLSAEAPVQRLNAFNADGVMVAQLNFPTPPRQTEPLYFEWREGETYRFEATLTTGDVEVQTVTAPWTYTQGSLEIAIPYGVGVPLEAGDTTINDQVALVLHDSEMTATVLVRNGKTPATFEVELYLPPMLTVVDLPTGWQTETTDAGTCLSITGRFRVASEVWYRELVLKTSTPTNADREEISGVVRFTTDIGQTWEQQTRVQLRAAPVSEITEYLSIESIEMPTDATGAVDAKQRQATLYYPRPLFSWLDTSQTNPFEPTTFQTIRLYNQGEEIIHVAVSSINRDIKTGEVVPFLAPPETANGGTNQSVAFASLPGGEVTEIPLPIYFHPTYLKAGKIERAIPGEYTRDIVVKVWGSDARVFREERPLHLIVPNQQALLVSLLAIISSTIGLAVVLKLHKQLFAGFTTKQLIVIALFGTTVFVAVMVPSTLFLNLIRALLGPISVLLTGLINETLYYALLTALLIYISGAPDNSERDALKPRNKGSGVILLVSAVRLLLGGVTFGLFTPMAIVYTGTSVLLLETGFLFVRSRSLFVWAVVLGICDAIAVYVDFQLSILLYRLFYADWYIILRILIEGFVYTFIGVLLGARLGRGLWRVAD
ncbi:MAG: hypothetical protein OXI24_17055 [Candidatus Poribacteria bacterium]|nr:hypothetical protein [Candidatus Poribacteria bacterium]